MRREATMTYRMQMTRRTTIIPIATEKIAYILTNKCRHVFLQTGMVLMASASMPSSLLPSWRPSRLRSLSSWGGKARQHLLVTIQKNALPPPVCFPGWDFQGFQRLLSSWWRFHQKLRWQRRDQRWCLQLPRLTRELQKVRPPDKTEHEKLTTVLSQNISIKVLTMIMEMYVWPVLLLCGIDCHWPAQGSLWTIFGFASSNVISEKDNES